METGGTWASEVGVVIKVFGLFSEGCGGPLAILVLEGSKHHV
jgi:hypothetical protein